MRYAIQAYETNAKEGVIWRTKQIVNSKEEAQRLAEQYSKDLGEGHRVREYKEEESIMVMQTPEQRAYEGRKQNLAEQQRYATQALDKSSKGEQLSETEKLAIAKQRQVEINIDGKRQTVTGKEAVRLLREEAEKQQARQQIYSGLIERQQKAAQQDQAIQYEKAPTGYDYASSLFQKQGYQTEQRQGKLYATKEKEQIIVAPSGEILKAYGRVTPKTYYDTDRQQLRDGGLKFYSEYSSALGTGKMKKGLGAAIFKTQKGYNIINENLTGFTKKIIPSYESIQQKKIAGEQTPIRKWERENFPEWLIGKEVTKETFNKGFTAGARKEVITTFRDKPLNVISYAAGGLIFKGASKIGMAGKYSAKVFKTQATILGASWAGAKIYNIATSKTPEKKGAAVAQAGIEYGAFTIGYKAPGMFKDIVSIPKMVRGKIMTYKYAGDLKGNYKYQSKPFAVNPKTQEVPIQYSLTGDPLTKSKITFLKKPLLKLGKGEAEATALSITGKKIPQTRFNYDIKTGKILTGKIQTEYLSPRWRDLKATYILNQQPRVQKQTRQLPLQQFRTGRTVDTYEFFDYYEPPKPRGRLSKLFSSKRGQLNQQPMTIERYRTEIKPQFKIAIDKTSNTIRALTSKTTTGLSFAMIPISLTKQRQNLSTKTISGLAQRAITITQPKIDIIQKPAIATKSITISKTSSRTTQESRLVTPFDISPRPRGGSPRNFFEPSYKVPIKPTPKPIIKFPKLYGTKETTSKKKKYSDRFYKGTPSLGNVLGGGGIKLTSKQLKGTALINPFIQRRIN